MQALALLGLDAEGVRMLPGKTGRFTIAQLPGGQRQFTSDWGVARRLAIGVLPDRYLSASHIHLATGLPQEQQAWLSRLRRSRISATISVDTFEYYARAYPATSRRVCRGVDLLFINEEEHRLLGLELPPHPSTRVVLKYAPKGARYLDPSVMEDVVAPTAEAVDTTGAGDVLAGAFLALELARVPPLAALDAAVRIATASVETFGVDDPQFRAATASIATATITRATGSMRSTDNARRSG